MMSDCVETRSDFHSKRQTFFIYFLVSEKKMMYNFACNLLIFFIKDGKIYGDY